MSLIQRSLLPLALLGALGSTGCKDAPQGGANPEPSGTTQLPQPNRMANIAPQVKIDPLISKAYRAEACYYGTLSLRQARAAYLGSLGGAEPSANKLPEFGSPSIDAPPGPKGPSPVGSAAPSTSAPHPSVAAPAASAKAPPPKASAAPVALASAKPGSSTTPAGGMTPEDRAKAAGMERRLHSIPYDRFARSCTVAAGIKAPESPELDGALAEYAPWVVQLSKDLSTANMYYQKEDYKSDDFAKGKELHGKIVEGFKKLDEMQKKLEKGLADFEQKNPYDRQSWPESQKLSFAATDAARDVYVELQADKVDVAKVKAALDKLGQANDALKKYGEDHKDANDPFVRIVVPSIEIMIKQAQDIVAKPDFKAPEPADMVALTTYFTRVLEGSNRGVTRLLAEKEGAPAFQGPHRMPEGHPGLPAPAQQ